MIRVIVVICKVTKVTTRMILMNTDHQDHWLVTLHQGQGPLQSGHCCLDVFPAKENIHLIGKMTNYQIAWWIKA